MTRRTAAAVTGSLFLHAAAVWGLGLILRPADPPAPGAEVEVEVAAPPPEPEAAVLPTAPQAVEPTLHVSAARPDAAAPPAPETEPQPDRVPELQPQPEPEPGPEPAPEPEPDYEPETSEAIAPLSDPRPAPDPVPAGVPAPAAAEPAVAPQSREAAGPSVPAAAPPEASSPDTDYDATALEGYFSAVRARIEAAKRYPPWARRQGIEGRVTVAFRLTVGGDLAEARVQGSSGSAVLDQAAVEAVRRGAPYPRRPQAGPEELEVTLVFALR